ncbi:hypothetical protein ACFQY7_49000 [Actinomadura luteofluorescens]|uniref:hypothetical protein n=1 Tax=Actinomadura luteofluorescens TaxID=46163 RepID=UPI003642E940
MGGSGAVCGTAQNNQAAQYGLKVMRGKASCSQVRTVFTTYFGYIAEVEVRGYGYDGKPLTSAELDLPAARQGRRDAAVDRLREGRRARERLPAAQLRQRTARGPGR